MHTFADQVVLISGAGSGIGRQFAAGARRRGARVAAFDRAAAALAALEDEFKGRPYAGAVADVTDAGAVAAAVRDLEARLGPTDLLIASAGLGKETSALDFRAEDFAELIRVNLIGVSNTVAAVLPGMRERRRGHLAALSSLASWRGLPRMAGYCASKAGVNALHGHSARRAEAAQHRGDDALPRLGPDADDRARRPARFREALDGRGGRPPDDRRPAPAARVCAFPRSAVWQARLITYLPRRLADWLTGRYFRKMDRK